MIFDAFDADADGVLNAVEFSNLVGGGEQLSEDAFKNLAFLFSFSPAQGLGIDHLISFYFTEQGKRAGFEPNLDGDFSMAAKMIGLEWGYAAMPFCTRQTDGQKEGKKL